MDGSIRVLHVEDEPGFRDLTATILEREDDRFSVDTVAGVEDALDRLDGNTYDCIVSDYEMPVIDGIEFLEAVRETYPDLPFILFTGKGSEEIASEAMAAGVTDYLQKRGGTEQYELLRNRIDNAVSQYDAERELERQNDVFERAQKIARIGAWEANLRTGEGWWSEQVNRIYGLPQGYEPELNEGFEFFHPEDRPVIEDAYFRAIERGERYDHELRVVRDNGTVRWVRVIGNPQFENGEVVSIRGTIQDITEQKRRRRVLEALHREATEIQSEETVESVCEHTVRAAASVLDLDVCSVLIRDGEWLVPRATSADAPPDSTRSMRIDQGLAGKTYQSGEPAVIEEITPSDETDPASRDYRSGLSVPIGGHGVFQAVSTEVGAFDSEDTEFVELLVSHTESALDRITREQELQRQNERLSEFASIVSHDLRNPLSVAQLQLELARDQADNQYLETIAEAHDRMETLIDDLLMLARAGEPVDEVQSVSLQTLAESAWQHVETTGSALDTDTDSVIRADSNRLQQLFENLMRNSVEHGPTNSRTQSDDAVEHGSSPDSQTRQDAIERGSVTVRIGELDGQGFVVEDDGCGIPEDQREDVFESGYSTASDGTGFGLAIVEDVVEAHDWNIAVTESDEGGARFEITGVEFVRP